jgi:tetratricopeptide (TPR) repeat protein
VAEAPLLRDVPSRLAASLYLLHKASYHAFLGERDEALGLARRAIEVGDGIAEVHLLAGGWLISWDDLDAAATEFQKATLEPVPPGDAWYGLGMIRARQGDPERAVEALRRALELRTPNSHSARIILAAALYDLGDFETARAICEEVLAVQPTEAITREVLKLIGERSR